jgi:PAS domain S-box-containing protein
MNERRKTYRPRPRPRSSEALERARIDDGKSCDGLEMNDELKVHESSAEHAEQLFEHHQQEMFRKTDKFFAWLLPAQWLASILVALFVAPQAWAGKPNPLPPLVAIIFGAVVSAIPLLLVYLRPGSAATRYTVAISQMLMSALFIELTGGRIATHFHVFVSLILLSFYRDWRVFIPATLIVLADHILCGAYWPFSIYGVQRPSAWPSVEHGLWILFAEIFLVLSCLRSVRRMSAMARRAADLEASERNFRESFEEAPIGMALVGLDEHFLRANASLCQMLGYSEEELVQLKTEDITFPDDIEEGLRLSKALIGGTTRHTGEQRYLRKNKEMLWVSRTASIIRDKDNTPRHFLIMVEDITQRKKAAVALQEARDLAVRANRAKSEFLSRMSHELRTPLNAILGFSQVLDRQDLPRVQRDRVGHIYRAGQHLLSLINEVLEIARIETGKIQLSVEPVCVGDALSEALDIVRPLASQRRIQIQRNDYVSAETNVLADRQRFKQVLLNLLSNAVKYNCDAGSIVIALEQRSAALRISISDSGPGIPKEKRDRLFVAFDRLGAENQAVQGTGLGLALSKRLTEAMGGRIGESQPEKGASFWIEFPIVASPRERIATDTRKVTVPFAGIGKQLKTLLYIEDNVSNLTLIEHLLGEHPPIKLISAMQGNLGLELAARHRPDLVLLDLHLPDMGGAEVLSKLKADSRTSAIPVIMLSADATKSQIDKLMVAGASDYLTKPLDVDRFLKAIETHLQAGSPLSTATA